MYDVHGQFHYCTMNYREIQPSLDLSMWLLWSWQWGKKKIFFSKHLENAKKLRSIFQNQVNFVSILIITIYVASAQDQKGNIF